MIEKEYMGEWFRYDPEEGKLWRKYHNGNWVPIAEAHKNKDYPQVFSLAYTKEKKNVFIILAHRLVWILVNGEIPEGMLIDHINGISTDYKLSNLRLVTPTENQRNTRVSSNNRTGIIGVYRRHNKGMWLANITVNNKLIHLGSFKTKKAAAMARFAAELEHGFHVNHGRKPVK